MASYFNKDKETDWAIFGGMYGDAIWNKFNVYTTYRNCLQSDEWIQSNKTNERIITDEQFAGRLKTKIKEKSIIRCYMPLKLH